VEGLQRSLKAAKELTVPGKKMRTDMDAVEKMGCVQVGVLVNDAIRLDVI
jgi:hypothetical protein